MTSTLTKEYVIYAMISITDDAKVSELKTLLPKISPAIEPVQFIGFLEKCSIKTDNFGVYLQYFGLETTPAMTYAVCSQTVQGLTNAQRRLILIRQIERGKIQPIPSWNDFTNVMSLFKFPNALTRGVFYELLDGMKKGSAPTHESAINILKLLPTDEHRLEILKIITTYMSSIPTEDLYKQFIDTFVEKDDKWKVQAIVILKTKLKIKEEKKKEKIYSYTITVEDRQTEVITVTEKFFKDLTNMPYQMHNGTVVMLYRDGSWKTAKDMAKELKI